MILTIMAQHISKFILNIDHHQNHKSNTPNYPEKAKEEEFIEGSKQMY